MWDEEIKNGWGKMEGMVRSWKGKKGGQKTDSSTEQGRRKVTGREERK